MRLCESTQIHKHTHTHSHTSQQLVREEWTVTQLLPPHLHSFCDVNNLAKWTLVSSRGPMDVVQWIPFTPCLHLSCAFAESKYLSCSPADAMIILEQTSTHQHTHMWMREEKGRKKRKIFRSHVTSRLCASCGVLQSACAPPVTIAWWYASRRREKKKKYITLYYKLQTTNCFIPVSSASSMINGTIIISG